MKQSQLLAAILGVLSPLASAADNEIPGEIVVTATRVEQPLRQSLSSSSVITRADIQDSQAVDLPSVLKNLAGVEFYQSGGIGKQSSLFMRGSNSSQVLVLLDGVRINSATSGTTAIDQIMLDQVERIEVVRGNASSLYGSEAIGGVIQIFTRRGKGEMAFNGSAEAGSYNTKRVSAGLGGQAGNTEFSLQASNFKTDGVSAIDSSIVTGVNPDNDGYENASLSANVRHAFSADHGLALTALNSQGQSQYDSAFGASAAEVNESKSQISKLSLTSDNRLNTIWQSKLQWAQSVDEYKGLTDGVQIFSYKTSSDQVSWQNNIALSSWGELMLGAEALGQKVASQTAYTRTERTVNSVFGGYTGNYGAHQVQLNVRQDNYSDFGVANTGLFGYGYHISDSWRVAASTSTAFKAPTINDLFYPLENYGGGYSYQGNPDLQPERSHNNELGVHYAHARQSLDLTYFDNHISGLIVNNNLPASTMLNLNEARIDGVEASYSGQFDDTGVKLAITGQNPRDAATGQTLLRRAKLFSSASVSQQLGTWKAAAEWQYSGEREDANIQTGVRTMLGSYSLVNVTARYQLSKHLDASLRLDNLLNRDYMLAHGYNTLGRTLFVGVSYQ